MDPWFLVAGAPEAAQIVRKAREVNDHKAVHTENRIRALLNATPGGKVALLGLAFKPDIDDFRESPALEIAKNLAQDLGDQVLVVEPFAQEMPESLQDTGAHFAQLGPALQEADVVVILVDHTQFKQLGKDDLSGKVVFDTRGMLKR